MTKYEQAAERMLSWVKDFGDKATVIFREDIALLAGVFVDDGTPEVEPDGKILLLGKIGEWNWHAHWKLHENGLCVTYSLFQEQGRRDEPEDRGEWTVKWDGCSMGEVGGHFCSQRECVELGKALALCWQHAKCLMDDKWCHSEENAIPGLDHEDMDNSGLNAT